MHEGPTDVIDFNLPANQTYAAVTELTFPIKSPPPSRRILVTQRWNVIKLSPTAMRMG